MSSVKFSTGENTSSACLFNKSVNETFDLSSMLLCLIWSAYQDDMHESRHLLLYNKSSAESSAYVWTTIKSVKAPTNTSDSSICKNYIDSIPVIYNHSSSLPLPSSTSS